MTDARPPNADQIVFWNGPAGDRWAATWQLHDRTEAAISDSLLALAAPAPGERALDIGCGAGSTTLRLHERVGPTGAVTGIDVSAQMLAVARARAGEGVRFLEADASIYPFEPAFDLLCSRFGVMFFNQPEAAFENLRRAAAAGGRLAFVAWRRVEDNPWATVPLAAARPVLPEAAPPPPDRPGPFGLADRDRALGILARAGWRDVAIERHDHAMFLGSTAEEAADTVLASLLLPRFTGGLSADARARLRDLLIAELAPYHAPGGVTLAGSSWLASARA